MGYFQYTRIRQGGKQNCHPAGTPEAMRELKRHGLRAAVVSTGLSLQAAQVAAELWNGKRLPSREPLMLTLYVRKLRPF